MQKEILRTRYFLKHNRFKQSQLTLCTSLPRAQLLCCSAGLTMRSTSKSEDSVHQIILVREFSLSMVQKDRHMELYQVVIVLISVLLFYKWGVVCRSAAAFSDTERFQWSWNHSLVYTSVADRRQIQNQQNSLKAFVFKGILHACIMHV